jgi:hypothetical protein
MLDGNTKAADVKTDSIFMLLPDKIGNPHNQEYNTMCGQCLLTEIERLNAFLRFLASKLADAMQQAKDGTPDLDTQMFVKGQVPLSWKKVSGYYWTDAVPKITSHLIQRNTFLLAWMRERPQIIDARAIDDLRSFMFAFLSDTAVSKGAPENGVIYEFSIVEQSTEVPPDAFGLKGVYMVAGGIENGKLSLPPEEGATSQKLPLLLCKVVEKAEDVEEEQLFKCPLYRTAFVNELNMNEEDFELSEAEFDNFVWEVALATDEPEIDFILTGTALFCRVPDQIA